MPDYTKTVESWEAYWDCYSPKLEYPPLADDSSDEDDGPVNKDPSAKQSNQLTLAIGWSEAPYNYRFAGARQGGTLPPNVIGMAPPPRWFGQPIMDARVLAFDRHRSPWKASEATGVHAEAIIIRAWLMDMQMVSEDGLKALRDRSVIVSSQPACWFCKKLMQMYGIAYSKRPGKKPLTAWRHPLANNSVPQSDFPAKEEDVTKEWIQNAAKLGYIIIG